ncbi:MAG: peptidyl-prolyl cis-trans isomerase [Planctomycetia bacterium]|nr:peptidyl-prolyl cis-trans isomerase [Planctomycetia bacterium]
MNRPGARPRASTPLFIAGLAGLCLAATPLVARAQRIANQFDEAAANATQAPAAVGQPGPNGTAAPQLVPTIPKAVSRPEGWPGKKAGKAADNHVLSSIRSDPDAPIVPIDFGPDLPGTKPDGVVQAQYQEPVSSGGVAASDSDRLLAEAQSLETAMVVARVGPEVVLEGDLLTPSALNWLAKVSPGLKPEQVRELKLQICRQVLPQHVESLIVYVDACRTIPEDRLPEIEKKVNQAFDEQQLPRMLKDAGVANSLEYEQLLRSRGQSLDRVRKMFFERALAQQWIQQKVAGDEEIPHADMIAWYENHLAEYEFPAKAKFEQLTVRVGPTQPREAAWNKLAAMGNDVLEGKPFADIAKARSEGATASTGGGYDWTTKGSLASKVLDEAVFTLPVGQLSAILDDGQALHIVRVTERTEAGRRPFLEAQVEIRQMLQEERRKRDIDDYLAKLKDRTPVWTIFDDQAPTATAQVPGGGRMR